MSETPNIDALKRLPRYAPDAWGQMSQIEVGDVWDEEPAHLYLRERDVVALFQRLAGGITPSSSGGT